MLDADVDPVHWLGDTPAPPAPEPRLGAGPRRWWIAAAAVGGIVALVVAANAIGGPNERPRAAPTTTAAVTTSTARPTTTAPPTTERDGGLVVTSGSLVGTAPPIIVADPPPGYTVAYAEHYDGGFSVPGSQLLFASGTDPATASWIVATVAPSPTIEPAPLFGSGTVRLPVADGVALLDHDGDQTSLTASIAGGTMTLWTLGVDDATLAAIVDEAAIDGERLASDAPFTSRGLQLLAASETDPVQASWTATTIGFSAADDPNASISVSYGARLSSFERAMRTFMLRDARVVTVGGVHTAIVGRSGFLGDLRTAIVDLDGVEVTVSGQVPEEELLTIAQTLRVASTDEWSSLRMAALQAQAEAQANPSASTFTSPIPLRSGTMTGAAAWQLTLQPSSGPGTEAFLTIEMTGSTTGQFVGSVMGGTSLDESLAAGQPGLQSIATSSGVVLVGAAGRDHAGARLVVTAGDMILADDLTDPGVDAPALFGAVAYSELVPYHAELIGADGTVLATLDGM